jgi:apolipoprotein N-acyltransferase
MANEEIQKLRLSNDTERQLAKVKNEISWGKIGGPFIVLLSVPLWAAGVAVLRQFSFSWITIPAFTLLWFGCYAKAAHDTQHETRHAVEDDTDILQEKLDQDYQLQCGNGKTDAEMVVKDLARMGITWHPKNVDLAIVPLR